MEWTDDAVLGLARDLAERLMASTGDAEGRADLADGEPGVALALRYAAEVFGEDRYLKAGRLHLRRTAATTATTPLLEAGLFSGTAGVVWAVTEYARVEPRYLPTLATMTGQLARQTLALKLPSAAGSVSAHDYDVIAGSSGWLTTLLKATDVLTDVPGAALTRTVREATDRLVDHLLALARDDGGPLNWFCAPSCFPVTQGPDGRPTPLAGYTSLYPDGVYNLGFAHGPAGILAALCRVAVTDGRAREAVRELARTVAALRIDGPGPGRPAWDTALPPHPGTGRPDTSAPRAPARTAWCYGVPGVATALLSASAVLDDPELADVATAALLGVAHAPAEEQRLDSPTLCHGLAGLLPVYARAAATGPPELRRMHDDFRARLCAYADQSHPFLFADRGPTGDEHRAGLLNGGAGVLLALLGSVSPSAAAWDELLFLTPGPAHTDHRGSAR